MQMDDSEEGVAENLTFEEGRGVYLHVNLIPGCRAV